MENAIRTILIQKLKAYFQGFTTKTYNDEIINIVTFHPFELNFDDLNNISANGISFRCIVKGKIKGVVSQVRNYSFNISGIVAVMENNAVTDLNLENMNMSFLNRLN